MFDTTSRVLCSPVVLAISLLLLTTPASASPLISVGDCLGCVSWSDAITAGNVQAADPFAGLTNPEIDFFTGTGESFSLANQIEVFPVPGLLDANGLAKDALVMSWDDTGSDLSIGAWEYVYDVDPDLTGTIIELSLLPLNGIWDFSIELIDVNGFVRGWFVDPSTIGPLGFWQTVSLDPTQLLPQGFIPGALQDPLFDITQVLTIRLDEAGMTTVSFPAPPPGGSLGGPGIQWNAWDHLVVKAVPEPGATLLLGLALLGLGWRRRR